METVNFIDIKDEPRIRAILADEANHVLEAFACEFLDGWTPDVGLTEYPARSIFRPPSVIQAGITSSIRHRFIFERRHLGTRYVGVLLYDAADEKTELEFKIRDEELGRIVTRRHDNRRHLLIFPHSCDFNNNNDVFQIFGRGGRCRIEKIVLFRDRPEPTDFTPQIENIGSRRIETESGTAIEVSFTTTEAARSRVTVLFPAPERFTENSTESKVHRLLIGDAVSDHKYRLRITATEREGASSTVEFEVPAATDKKTGLKTHRVPVTIINTGSEPVERPVLEFGVPVPPKIVPAVSSVSLEINGRILPAQGRIHSRRRDGSARWVLISTLLDRQLNSHEALPARVLLNTKERNSGAADKSSSGTDGTGQFEPDLLVREDNEGFSVRGPQLKVRVAKNRFALHAELAENDGEKTLGQFPGNAAVHVELADGHILTGERPEDVRIIESGPLKVQLRIQVPVKDAAGRRHFVSTSYVCIYRDSPAIHLRHRLLVTSPALSPAGGGEAADPEAAKEFADCIDGSGNERESILRIRRAFLEIELANAESLQLQDNDFDVNGPIEMRQDSDKTFTIKQAGSNQEYEGHASGKVIVCEAGGIRGIFHRYFWQTYPKALGVESGSLRIELLPRLDPDDPPGDEDAWHRLYSWKKDDMYRIKAGMAIRSEFITAYGTGMDSVKTVLDSADDFVVVRPDLDAMNSADVWSRFCKKSEAPLKGYEGWVDAAYDGWMANRETYRQYGFINFGDWYGESFWSWGNNEYDPPFAQYMEFLREGNPGWAVSAAEAARHLADIDTINYSAEPLQEGGQYMHMPGHAGGYLPSYFRSKMKGSALRSHHMWVEGPVLHYLLTGDESIRETLEKIGCRVLQGFDISNYDFPNCRFAGWHLTHLCALARLGDNPDYINAARVIVDRVLERMTPGGAWDRLLTEPHCPCPPPRHTGGVGFMYNILLSGLRKYYEISGDERIKDAIIRGAEWLIDKTYRADTRTFSYTSCPNLRRSEAELTLSLKVLEGLTFAYSLDTSNTKIKDHILVFTERMDAYFTDPATRDFTGPGGFGKSLAFEMRYEPIIQDLLRKII
jgi:hypothetical protein